MSYISSSPPGDASVVARGLVNTTVQSFSGAKTFIGEVVASAGVRFSNNTLLTTATTTLTGDVTGSGISTIAATIAAGSVSLSKLAAVSSGVLLGRYSGGAGPVQAIVLGSGLLLTGDVLSATATGSGSVSDVSVVTANGVSGSVANSTTTPAITLTLGAITPASVAAVGTVTGSNLSGTNTGDQTITLTGDVTGSGTGSFAATIANSAVTLAKMADVATGVLLGRSTAGTGVVETITLGTGLDLTAGVLSSPDAGGTVTDVSVVTANGVSGSVANSTTTPAITLDLGDISPTSVETPTVFNTNGSGASDIVIKAGTTVAGASVSTSAKILSVRAGIGGTETEIGYFRIPTAFGGNLTLNTGGTSNAWPLQVITGTLTGGLILGTAPFEAGGSDIGVGPAVYSLRTTNKGFGFVVNGGAYAGSCTGSFVFTGSMDVAKPYIVVDASGVHTGALLSLRVSAVEQLQITAAGAVASARGTGASDVAVTLGSTVADASVHASAKLLSIQTGIGGTPVEKFHVTKDQVVINDGTGALPALVFGTSTYGINYLAGQLGLGFTSGGGTRGLIRAYTDGFRVQNATATGAMLDLHASLGSWLAGIGVTTIYSTGGAGTADVAVKAGTSIADASVHASAKLLSIQTGIGGTPVEKAYFFKDGTMVSGGVGYGTYVYNRVGGFLYDSGGANLLVTNQAGSAYLGLNLGTGLAHCSGTFRAGASFQWGGLATGGLYNESATQARLDAPASRSMAVTSPLGAGATDVAVKAGTTVAGVSVNATAKLFSVRTGIGGSEAEWFYFDADGTFWLGPNATIRSTGSQIDIGILPVRTPQYFIAQGTVTSFYASGGGAFGAAGTARLWSETLGAGAADVVVKAGAYIDNASVHASAALFSVRTGLGGTEVEYANITKSGGYCLGLWSVTNLATNGSTGTVTSPYVTAPGSSLSLHLYGGAGAGASDVVVKVGTSVATASVSPTAKLLSVRTGITGTEGESFYVKNGNTIGGGADALILGSSSISVLLPYFSRANAPLGLYAAGTSGITETVRIVGQRGDAGLKCVTLGTESASPNNNAILTQFAKGINVGTATDVANGTALARVMASGRFDQYGTDSSATPGAATIDKPTGISAIASGATSVTITNALVPAVATKRIRIMFNWNGDHGAARSWATQTPAGGSFVVSLSAAASADTIFSWELAELL